MGTKVEAPKVDVGGDVRKATQAQIDVFPQQVDLERRYTPELADIQAQGITRFLLGENGQEGVAPIFANRVLPLFSQVERDSELKQAEADVETFERLGGRFTEAQKSANPAQSRILDLVNRDVERSFSDTDRDARAVDDVRQGIRGAQAARGLGYGQGDAQEEAIGVMRVLDLLRRTNLQDASSAIALNQGVIGDQFGAIVGRPSRAPVLGGQFFQTGAARTSQLGPQLTDSSDPGILGLISQGRQNQFDAQVTNANTRAGLLGGLLSLGGSLGGAALLRG